MEEILFEKAQYRLFKDGNSFYFSLRSYDKKTDRSMKKVERICTFHIDEEATSLIQILIESGCSIHKNLNVIDPQGHHWGSLRQHIVANYHGLFLEDVITSQVKTLKKFGTRDYTDLRAENLLCKLVPRRENTSIKVLRKWDDLAIVYKSDGGVFYTDYTSELDEFLQSNWPLHWHMACRKNGKRLLAVIPGCGSPLYIYHLRLIQEIYGLPSSFDDFLILKKLFQSEYLDEGLTVDHLDKDPCNNRLSNLFIMSRSQNTRKENLLKQITAPYTWNSKRIDKDTIRVQGTKETEIVVCGDYSLEGYMEALQGFVDMIKITKNVSN